MNNLRFFEKMGKVPKEFLSKIPKGPMAGKSSIDSQWRLKKMTEVFGPCGSGWKYEIVRVWTEPGPGETVACFCQINLYWREDPQGPWSDPIPGIGGNQLIQKFSRGLNLNDEGYKMALTDALSVAGKALGVASLIYEGAFDGDKYLVDTPATIPKENKEDKAPPCPSNNNRELDKVTEDEALQALSGLHTYKEICDYMQSKSIAGLTSTEAQRVRKFALSHLSKINQVSLSEWAQVFTETDPDLVTPESFAGFEKLSPVVQKELAKKFSNKFPDFFKEVAKC